MTRAAAIIGRDIALRCPAGIGGMWPNFLAIGEKLISLPVAQGSGRASNERSKCRFVCCSFSLLRGRSARPSFHRLMPPNFMHAPLIKPFFWFSCQAGSHRIFTDILPFLRIAFSATQTMMETGALKSSSLVAGFRKLALPKRHPVFDSKLQVIRRAKQMQMVRHQKIIADQPGSG